MLDFGGPLHSPEFIETNKFFVEGSSRVRRYYAVVFDPSNVL
jgi:hypothetical protein